MPQAGFKLWLQVKVYLNLVHALTYSATTASSTALLLAYKNALQNKNMFDHPSPGIGCQEIEWSL